MNRLAILAAAPHRAFFLIGALQGVAAIAWWLVDLAGRYGGWYPAPAWTVPPPWAHAYLFLYGFFPSFIFGFLLTAMPNWLGVAPRRPRYVLAATLLGAGLVVIYLGLAAGRPPVVAGLALHLAGWLLALLELVRLLRLTRSGDLAFPLAVVALVGAGWLGAATLFAAVAFDVDWAWEVGKRGAWFFLLPLFFAISHRMVPYFSSRVLSGYAIWRPGCGWRWLWLVDAPLATIVEDGSPLARGVSRGFGRRACARLPPVNASAAAAPLAR
jgi:uncharacterized protein involved in response to NO